MKEIDAPKAFDSASQERMFAIAMEIEQNGESWQVELEQLRADAGGMVPRCWVAHGVVALAAAMLIEEYGEQVQVAVGSSVREDWASSLEVMLAVEEQRVDLQTMASQSLTCESGGPVPDEATLRPTSP